MAWQAFSAMPASSSANQHKMTWARIRCSLRGQAGRRSMTCFMISKNSWACGDASGKCASGAGAVEGFPLR